MEDHAHLSISCTHSQLNSSAAPCCPYCLHCTSGSNQLNSVQNIKEKKQTNTDKNVKRTDLSLVLYNNKKRIKLV